MKTIVQWNNWSVDTHFRRLFSYKRIVHKGRTSHFLWLGPLFAYMGHDSDMRRVRFEHHK